MSPAVDILPTSGEIVRVRSRRYLVEGVQLGPEPGDDTLVRLSCLEDDAEGEALEVLWEKEVDAQRINEADCSKLAQGQFDPPKWPPTTGRFGGTRSRLLIPNSLRLPTALASASTPTSSSRSGRRCCCRASIWIPQPTDWPPRNLRPMRYDLEAGEGARVWQACLERLASHPPAPLVEDILHVAETQPAYGAPGLVRPRLGKGAFRVAVTDAYQRSCAVTGEHSLPVLEAAHIRPFALRGAARNA